MRALPDKEIRSPGIVPSKKNSKVLPREESKLSLFERRNSNNEEDTVSTVTRTPETPITPVNKEQAAPPCPPRHPLNDAPAPSSSNFFNFNFPIGGVEEEDAPPPLPPRDDVPLSYHYEEQEPEFFLNQDIITLHHPQGYFNSRNNFSFPDSHQELPPAEPSSSVYPSRDISFPYPDPTFSYPFNHVPDTDQAPPVPPRDACWDVHPPRENQENAPAIPPRDPPPQTVIPPRDPLSHTAIPLRDPLPHSVIPPRDPLSHTAIPPRDPFPHSVMSPETPMFGSRFDNYNRPRYVPEPTRYSSSRFNDDVDTPPPIPRRQPRSHDF